MLALDFFLIYIAKEGLINKFKLWTCFFSETQIGGFHITDVKTDNFTFCKSRREQFYAQIGVLTYRKFLFVFT